MNTPFPKDAALDATDAGTYHCWREDGVRFNDVDPLWHLTSTAFMVMFETARILFVRAGCEATKIDPSGWMLVNANITYLAQVYFPEQVRIGTRVERIGRSSLTTVQGMFVRDKCVATLETVMVFVDREKDRSTPLPEELRASLQSLSDAGSLGVS